MTAPETSLRYHPATPDLCARIAAGQESAADELYQLIGRAIQSKFRGSESVECEDAHHDVYLVVISAIRSEQIRTPGAILAYASTVIARRKAQAIDFLIQSRRTVSLDEFPLMEGCKIEAEIEQRDQLELVRSTLKQLPPTQREIIERFYFAGQPKEHIMAEMTLNMTQYRLMKSRAIERLSQHREFRTEKWRRARQQKAVGA